MKNNLSLNQIIVSLTLVSILILSGCDSTSGTKQAQYNFKQGTSSLEWKFLENAPPEEIYPKSNFKIILGLDNQMAYDLYNGKVKILGLDEQFFKISPASAPNNPDFGFLEGRSLTNPAGEKKFVTFDGQAFSLFANAENYQANYFLRISYNSRIDFTDSVCLNPKLYEFYDAGCKVVPEKSYPGQGGPLAVTEIKEIVHPAGSGANFEFRFRLENRGNGQISKIALDSASLGGKNLEKCQFQDAPLDKKSIPLYQDKQEAVLICEHLLSGQESYTTPISLSFSYDYEIEEQHNLKMVK